MFWLRKLFLIMHSYGKEMGSRSDVGRWQLKVIIRVQSGVGVNCGVQQLLFIQKKLCFFKKVKICIKLLSVHL